MSSEQDIDDLANSRTYWQARAECAELARDEWRARAEAAERRLAEVTAEVDRLRANERLDELWREREALADKEDLDGLDAGDRERLTQIDVEINRLEVIGGEPFLAGVARLAASLPADEDAIGPIDERDDALARAEAAEAKLAAVRQALDCEQGDELAGVERLVDRAESAERRLAAAVQALAHPSHKNYRIVEAVREALDSEPAEPHLVSVARLAASLPVSDDDRPDPVDRSGESRKVVSRRPWQRKPVTHEWAYAHHLFAVCECPGWTIGSARDARRRMPMSRPIKPAEGSERGDA